MENKEGQHNVALEKFLIRVSRFSTSRPKTIMLVTAIIAVISIIGITKIRFSHAPLEWLPKDNDIRIATEKIDMKKGM